MKDSRRAMAGEVQGIYNDTWLVVILVFSDGLTHLSSDYSSRGCL